MHAIRQHEFGPADNLVYDEVPDPVPAEGQVRIAVEAAGVHLLDTVIRKGESGGPYPLPDLPMTPGREVAGRVDLVGPGVDEAWHGRRAVVHLGMASGGYAELAVTSVEALHEIPDHLAADVAVAMIGTGRTAMGILEVAELTKDDVVLVTAAAGGIGSLLVQSARNEGAVVVGVAGGPDKVERVRALGAAVAVDYRDADWTKAVRAALDNPGTAGGRGVSVALDGVGGEIGRGALELLVPGGRIVLFGWSSGEPLEITTSDLYAGGITASAAVGPRMLQRPGGLRDLETRSLAEAAAGRLTPLLTRFPLAEAAKAHEALETRATTGKVVLVP
ncbi:MAG TPA: zinc-binding dehydrogenase [Acidimicrobiales bacterium]|jgi:NADPH2:quinone reductase|nr:zinc-binding dehydrogenase [Acidimicrobiales bacterium]